MLAIYLTTLDFLTLIGYFVILILAGLYAMRKVHDSDDFFIAGRRFGKFFTAFLQFGASTNTDGPILVADQTFRNGFSGIWINLFWILMSPYHWFKMLWFRRLRYVTSADFVEDRYRSKILTTFYALFTLIVFAILISAGLTAIGESTASVLGWTDNSSFAGIEDPYLAVIVLSIILVIIYGVCGGLGAAVITDLFQSMFMIFISFVMIPIMFTQCGGIGGVRHVVPKHLFDMFGSSQASAYTWYSITALVLLATVSTLASPAAMLVNSAKDEKASQIGGVGGLFIKRICTIGWGLTGLMAIVFLRRSEVPTNQTFGMISAKILGPLGLGLLGIVIAGLLSALMSSADAFMVSSAAVFTRNLYKPLIAPNRSERHYVVVGRITSVVVMLIAGYIAYDMRNVLQQFKLFLSSMVIFAPVFWLGFFWRRANAKAALCTVILSMLCVFIIPKLVCFTSIATEPRYLIRTKALEVKYENQIATQYDIDAGLASELGQVFSFTDRARTKPVFFTELITNEDGRVYGAGSFRPEIYLLSVIGFNVAELSIAQIDACSVILPIGLPMLIMYLAARLTRPMDKRLLDLFFARMITPATGSHKDDLKKIAETGANFEQYRDRLVFRNSDWIIAKPTTFQLSGLVAVTLISIAFIFLVWLITLIGRG
jgi:SSS family solute:Na+ symporter